MTNEAHYALKAAGVNFLEQYDKDKFFIRVALPEDWSIAPSPYPMFQYPYDMHGRPELFELLDSLGRPRATIHHRAESLTTRRTAELRILPRFRIRDDSLLIEAARTFVSHVLDGRTVVFTSKPYSYGDGPNDDDRDEAAHKAWTSCEKWLKRRGILRWHDPELYWDHDLRVQPSAQ